MITPKVLVEGKFYPQDLKISISEPNRKIEPKIEGQLEEIWQQKVKLAKEKSQNIYNGISYRLNYLKIEKGHILLDLATMEYKVRDGLIDIPEYYKLSEEYYRKGCHTGASVKTSNGLYIMVELSGKSMNENKIEVLGGILETPPDVVDGTGIFSSLYREMREEALINESDIIESYLRAIFLDSKTNIGLYFEVVLKVTSEEIVKRHENGSTDTDIKSIKFFSKEEYLSELANHNTNKQLISKLLLI